jgi:hypothetical protein
MAQSSLVKKLLIKPGQRIAIINPPTGYMDELGALPEGVELEAESKAKGTFDLVQLFVRNVEELNRLGPKAIRAVKHDGLLWICYPKRSSRVETDITRDAGWSVIEKAGLEGVAQVSINDIWSALRFRPAELVGKKK